jgi:hypothetical protein
MIPGVVEAIARLSTVTRAIKAVRVLNLGKPETGFKENSRKYRSAVSL